MLRTFDPKRFLMVFGIAMVILLVIAVPLGLLGPTKPDTNAYTKEANAAIKAADENSARAVGAPQQQVVNGWLQRDLMEVQIAQTNDELVLLHLAVALLIATLLAVVVAGIFAFRPVYAVVPVAQAPQPETAPVTSG